MIIMPMTSNLPKSPSGSIYLIMILTQTNEKKRLIQKEKEKGFCRTFMLFTYITNQQEKKKERKKRLSRFQDPVLCYIVRYNLEIEIRKFMLFVVSHSHDHQKLVHSKIKLASGKTVSWQFGRQVCVFKKQIDIYIEVERESQLGERRKRFRDAEDGACPKFNNESLEVGLFWGINWNA